MDRNLRIVVVDPAKGGAKAVYIGVDAAEADKAFDSAADNKSNEAVRLFVYPHVSKLRYPAEESTLQENHRIQAEADAQAAKDAEIARLQKDHDVAEAALAAAKGDAQGETEASAEEAEPKKAKGPKKEKVED